MSNGSNFEWHELIDLASNMKTNTSIGSTEAIDRCAISRAYYGAFCLARNLGVHKGWFDIKNTGADHDIVKKYYKNNKNKTKMNIGLSLERLHIERKYADYDNICCDSDKKAQACINRARTIKDQLSSLA